MAGVVAVVALFLVIRDKPRAPVEAAGSTDRTAAPKGGREQAPPEGPDAFNPATFGKLVGQPVKWEGTPLGQVAAGQKDLRLIIRPGYTASVKLRQPLAEAVAPDQVVLVEGTFEGIVGSIGEYGPTGLPPGGSHLLGVNEARIVRVSASTRSVPTDGTGSRPAVTPPTPPAKTPATGDGADDTPWELVKVISEDEVVVLPDRVQTNYGKFLRITVRFSGPRKNRSLAQFDVADDKGVRQGLAFKKEWQNETTAQLTFTGIVRFGDFKGLYLTDGTRSKGLETASEKTPAGGTGGGAVKTPEPPAALVAVGPSIQDVVADCPDQLPPPQPGANSSLDGRPTGKNSLAKLVRWKGKVENVDKSDPTSLEIIVASERDPKGNRTVYQANLKLNMKPAVAPAKGTEIWFEGVVAPRMLTGRDFRPTLLTHHYVILREAKVVHIVPSTGGFAPRSRPPESSERPGGGVPPKDQQPGRPPAEP